jgi:16S rRNA (uracil1498-N3)-methyltransferase
MSKEGSTVTAEGVQAGVGAPRLYLKPLAGAMAAPLDAKQAHYLSVVLRLAPGAPVRVFNETDGEWLARLAKARRNDWSLTLERKLAAPQRLPDLWYLFAPLKHDRLDYLAQKATEMGASRLIPVITDHTHRQRLNLDRLRANAIEAAEQCGLVSLPEVADLATLDDVLSGWPSGRALIWCDEERGCASPLRDLAAVPPGPLGVLIGPEGGFSRNERERLRALPHVHAISLGPRILRADTAAVAALALVQATLGDWGTATLQVTD